MHPNAGTTAVESQPEQEVRELPLAFVGKGEVKGFEFRQIEKCDRGYLYEVTQPESGYTYFEVFKRRVNDRFGVVSYPLSASFGRWAWTTPSRDRAYEIYNQICDLSDKSWRFRRLD